MIGLARLAAPIACIGLAVLLMARTRQNRIAGLGYAAVGTVLLAASLAVARRVRARARDRRGARARLGAQPGVFRREPWLVAYLALAASRSASTSSHHHLLVPLFVVAAGAAFNLLRELVDGDGRSRELGRATKPLALYLLWIGISMTWTNDIRTGAIDILASYIPFTIIALSVARLPWKRLRVKLLYGELAAMALVFACVGFYQYETRHIFENPKLHRRNSYAALFRVNSRLLRPVDLRALPRRRARRDRGAHRARQVAARRPRRARASRSCVARAARLVLAVELLRALRRRLLPLRVRLAVEGARACSSSRSCSSSRERSPRRSSCTRFATTASTRSTR